MTLPDPWLNHVSQRNFVAVDERLGALETAQGRGDLRVKNSAAATTLGTVTDKLEVFDADGNSLGFIPIYDAIT